MLAYRVCRAFEDRDGPLVVGETPPIERVRSWPNLESLMALAMVEIFDQDGTATMVGLSFDTPPTETEADRVIRNAILKDIGTKAKPAKGKVKGVMCDICGNGPFVRMDRHMMKHRIETEKETN